MASIIKFRIDKKGNAHLEVDDSIVGTDCTSMTAAFEDALGIKVDVQTKPQFYDVIDGIENKVTND